MKNRLFNNERGIGLTKLISSMIIFGTVGLVVRAVGLGSGFVAMARGFIGALVLAVLIFVRGKRPDFLAIKKNATPLLLSGAFIGFNWILLFESYRYTTVAVATLTYYTAPVFVALLAPIFLGTRLSVRRVACVFVALLGMALVSEFWSMSLVGGSHIGILCALGAAFLYALVTLLNKKILGVPDEDRTLSQLLVASLVVLPYTFIVEEIRPDMFTPTSVALLLVLGVLHTGVAYSLYFGSISLLPADTVAIFSYVDPVLAVLLSAIFLEEKISIFTVLGAALILLSAYLIDKSKDAAEKENT